MEFISLCLGKWWMEDCMLEAFIRLANEVANYLGTRGVQLSIPRRQQDRPMNMSQLRCLVVSRTWQTELVAFQVYAFLTLTMVFRASCMRALFLKHCSAREK